MGKRPGCGCAKMTDPNEPKYLITLSQLKEMRSTKDPERRIEIYLDIVTPGPFKEKTAGAAIVGGLGKGLNAAFNTIDKMGKEDPPKKRSGKL
jgi:hypothetical protein